MSRRLPIDTMKPQKPLILTVDEALPIILPAKVEALIKKLDCSKDAGEDNITGGVLQNGREVVVHLLTYSSTVPGSKSIADHGDSFAA